MAVMQQQQEAILQQLSNRNNRSEGQGTNRSRGFAGRGRRRRNQYRARTDDELAGQMSDLDDGREPVDYQYMVNTPTKELDENVRKAKNTLMAST
jgi:hypothetical protein